MPKTPSLNMDAKLEHALARSARVGAGHWSNVMATRQQFIHLLLEHKESAKKDGQCFLQGSVSSKTRSAKSMQTNYFLGVDLDSGDTAEEIDDKLAKTGLAYLRYTTYSHLKDQTEILREQFVKWSEQNPAEDSDPTKVRDYLITMKGIRPNIVEKLTIVHEAQASDNGTLLVVKHAPISKFRLVFFLKEPFIFQGKLSQKDRIQDWRQHNAGFCESLKLHYDASCLENARLFYMPTHPKKAKAFESVFFDGAEVDLESYQKVELGRGRSKKKTGNVFLDADVGQDSEDRNRFNVGKINLKKWASKYGIGFEIIDALETHAPDDVIVGDRNNGGCHVRCPNEEMHSTVGGMGSFAINASDNDEFAEGYHWACSHDACHGYDRLDMVKLAIENEWLPESVLSDPEFQCLETEDEVVEPEVDEAGLTDFDKLFNRANSVEPCEMQSIEGLMTDIQTAEQTGQLTLAEGMDLKGLVKEKSKVPARNFNLLLKSIKASLANDEDIQGEGVYDDPKLLKRLRRMNRRHAYIDMGNNCILDEANSEANEAIQLRSTRNFYEKYMPQTFVVDTPEGKKVQELSKLWMGWSDRRTYEGVQFEPESDDENMFNMFHGFPIEGDSKKDWSILKDFMHETVCGGNDEYMAWLLTWLAHIVQEPGSKPGSAVVVIGKKGTGKSTMFKFFARLMGTYSYTTSRSKSLTGEFNSHLMGKLFLQLEEGFFAGDKQAESVLKNMITETRIEFNKKFSDSITTSNYTRFAMTSNEDWVVPVSLEDERRFFVLEIGEEHKGDLEFFDKMHKQMNNGGLEGFMAYLEAWDPLEWFDEGWNILFLPPKTDALMTQAQESQSAGATFFQNMVEEGGLDDYDGDLLFALAKEADNFIPKNILFKAWSQYMKINPRQAARFSAGNKKLFAKEVEQYLFGEVSDSKKRLQKRGKFTVTPMDNKEKNIDCVHIPSTDRIREIYKERYQIEL